jgi:hypothetical protein
MRARTLSRIIVVLAGWQQAAAPPARGDESAASSVFRVRPYLQHPAADAMTVRWFSHSSTAGTLAVDGKTLVSQPILCSELDYQGAEVSALRHPAAPFLHSIRVTGLDAATSYPYSVTQDGETIRAILTTSPREGDVGRGGGVRLFFYSDARAQPESRTSRADWPPSGGAERPGWVGGRYPADETTAYRTNLALIAARSAESLRVGNPVVVSVVGDLVESGGEQRDWDEFWRHNAGEFGTLASRVPIVAAVGDHEMFGGPATTDPLTTLGGHSGPMSLLGSSKFLVYFEHPENGASDERHVGRYHRLDFGPVTLLTIDSTNGGADGGDADTNHLLDRDATPHVPDFGPGSEQRIWLARELADARRRGAITFVQFHHAPFSSGRHGRPPGSGEGRDEHSGRPLRELAPLLREHGVRAVFSGHDQLYEHSIVEGVHYYDVGIGGDGLPAPVRGVINERQIYAAHDHAPEQWDGDVLVAGGRHYGHVEVNVTRGAGDAGVFTVTIVPVHVFPVLDPDAPGGILTWERREYDDALSFQVDAGGGSPDRGAAASAPP